MGVAWPFWGKLRFFSFKVLPFGLSSACFCFTKLVRPLVKRWRSMSHCCFVFLDDRISGHLERVSASAASLLHLKDLELGGLKLNREKSMLELMQVGQWLGFVIDTIKMQFRDPPKKIAKLKSNLDSMISSGSATFRGLASLRSWRDFVRECFCFGSEAVNASGEAVRGLVKSRVEFPPAQISGVF